MKTGSEDMNLFCISALEKLSRIWDAPWLTSRVSIVFSPRLRTVLGCYKPSKNEIRLNVLLLDRDDSVLLSEVLCHEAAHVVNHARSGLRVKPHGVEWRALVRAAGYVPRCSLHFGMNDPVPVRTDKKKLYAHRCPVCQNVRYAGKSMIGWRCGDCLASGLGGELIIEKLKKRGV